MLNTLLLVAVGVVLLVADLAVVVVQVVIVTVNLP
jgi:hypothetical protein